MDDRGTGRGKDRGVVAAVRDAVTTALSRASGPWPSNGAKDALAKLVTRSHERIFRVSNGRLLGRLGGMPVVLLTTTGRRTGASRSTMLTAPVVEGERVVLVASYGGDHRHPAWYRNLLADPDVEVVMGGRRRPMRARTAGSEERAALWPRVTAAYRGYEQYSRNTEREIPVVILEPRDGAAGGPPPGSGPAFDG